MRENESVPVSEVEWDSICEKKVPTSDASEAERQEDCLNRWRAERKDSHREHIGVTAVRYAMLAIGLTAVAYLVRDMTGIAVGLGIVALIFGLTAAYGAGKYREM